MKRPGLALLIAGKLGKHDGEDQEDDHEEGDDPQEAKLDAVRHLIAAIHSKKEEDALECIENLLELCRDGDGPEENDEEASPGEEESY